MSSTEQAANRIFARPESALTFRYDGVVKNWAHLSLVASCWAILVAVLSCAGSAQKPAPKVPRAMLDCGAVAGQELRCSQLGFDYKVPFGWVDRTEEMQSAAEETHPAVPRADEAQQKHAETGSLASGAKTLLAIFQRPPEAPGATINSAVIIAAEPTSEYPKVKTAADYFGPLAEIAEQRGLKMDGDPYSFSVGVKQLVRGDFIAGSDKKVVHQTSLVTIEKGYILSFTFVTSSDAEIDDLISALSFGPRPVTHSNRRP